MINRPRQWNETQLICLQPNMECRVQVPKSGFCFKGLTSSTAHARPRPSVGSFAYVELVRHCLTAARVGC